MKTSCNIKFAYEMRN